MGDSSISLLITCLFNKKKEQKRSKKQWSYTTPNSWRKHCFLTLKKQLQNLMTVWQGRKFQHIFKNSQSLFTTQLSFKPIIKRKKEYIRKLISIFQKNSWVNRKISNKQVTYQNFIKKMRDGTNEYIKNRNSKQFIDQYKH